MGARNAARAERPVTARIRERMAEVEPQPFAVKPKPVAPTAIETKPVSGEPPAMVIPMREPLQSVVESRQRVVGSRESDARPMALF